MAFKTNAGPGRGKPIESNKYVCHQLHEETSGLVIKSNGLVFENHVDSWPVVKCLEEFIKSCAPKRLAQIRQVDIRDNYFICKVPEVQLELGKVRGNDPDPRNMHHEVSFLSSWPHIRRLRCIGPLDPTTHI